MADTPEKKGGVNNMRKREVSDEDLFNEKDIVRMLKDVLKNELTVYDLNESCDTREMPCVAFKVVDDRPNHMDVMVYAETEEKADWASKLVLTCLKFMERVGVTVYTVAPFGLDSKFVGPEQYNKGYNKKGIHTVLVRLQIRGK